MATPLDTGLLGHFEFIFPFLLVLVMGYAVLEKINLFKSKGISAFIAFLLAMMFSFSTIARETINTAAPWFILLIFFIVISLVAYMSLGATADDVRNVITSKNYKFINFWILTLLLIIVIGSLTTVMARHGGVGPGGSEEKINESGAAPSNQESDFWTTLFHPKVLGFIFIMLVSFFTVQRLTRE